MKTNKTLIIHRLVLHTNARHAKLDIVKEIESTIPEQSVKRLFVEGV